MRPATGGDAAFLCDLRNALASGFLSPLKATRAKTLALLGTSRTYIIERDRQRVASFALYRMHGPSAEFGRFMVVAEEQRNGVGTWTLEEAIKAARARGIRELTLTVRDDNKAAIDLYSSHGFFPVRRGPGYTVMRRVL